MANFVVSHKTLGNWKNFSLQVFCPLLITKHVERLEFLLVVLGPVGPFRSNNNCIVHCRKMKQSVIATLDWSTRPIKELHESDLWNFFTTVQERSRENFDSFSAGSEHKWSFNSIFFISYTAAVGKKEPRKRWRKLKNAIIRLYILLFQFSSTACVELNNLCDYFHAGNFLCVHSAVIAPPHCFSHCGMRPACSKAAVAESHFLE